jgi:serine/threonine protein kinase
LVTAQQCAQAVNQLQHECDALRTFTAQALDCAHLPKLHDANWEVTTAVPFLPLLPVGVPFERRWANTKPEKRGAEARQVLTDITAGLTAAHELHYCHRDVRPQNVVFHPETKSYVVIDWGLAAAPGEPMHPHKGGRCYWPDELVNAHNERETGTAYYPRHDLESARYVAWVFTQHRSLQVSWFEMAEYLVTMRQKEVGDWPCA